MLKEKISNDMKEAMKAHEELRLSTVRFLLSEIGKKEIELGKKQKGLSEEEIQQVVLREIKKRKEASEQFRKGGREDLAENEEKETKILEKYAPNQASEEDIIKIIDAIIKETEASSPADLGKVMAKVMQGLKGTADGYLVNELVRKKLS